MDSDTYEIFFLISLRVLSNLFEKNDRASLTIHPPCQEELCHEGRAGLGDHAAAGRWVLDQMEQRNV